MTKSRGIRQYVPRTDAWSAERDAKLRTLAAIRPALSARQIANRMGAPSKSSIIGRCRRLGIKLGTEPGWTSQAASAAVKKQRTSGARRGNQNNATWTKAHKVAARKTAPPLPQTPPSVPTICILALERRHCKFIGERPEIIKPETAIYCGERVQDDSSYCPHHHAICHSPLKRMPGAAFRLWRQPI